MLLQQRTALVPDEWRSSSLRAQQRLLELEEYKRASSIALYAPFSNEVDTLLIADTALKEGKQVLYPLVLGADMSFRVVEALQMLRPGRFGIMEPAPDAALPAENYAGLLVVPGVGFDHCGHRIGFGKGYYDRYLGSLDGNVCLVGLCHEFQLLEAALPAEPHDVRMDMVVTDMRVIRSGSERSR